MEAEQKFGIPNEKVRAIPFIISAVIVGELAPSNVVEMLKVELGLAQDKATELASFLKEKIFNPIAGGLLIISGIDVEPMPGQSAKEAKDAPGLEAELNALFQPRSEAKQGKPASSEIEPLVATPKPQPGMALPPTRQAPRPMNDIAAPKAAAPTQKPAPTEPKVTAAPKPFMLHEERPIAAEPIAPIRAEKNFSFDPGVSKPVVKPQSRPVAANFNSSFDSLLTPQKPAQPTVAKTAAEEPKVIHYTNFKTVLDESGNPKKP